MKPRFILASLDGDPGVTMANSHLRKLVPERFVFAGEALARQQYQTAVLEIFDIFDRCGLTGKATWFLNELDVRWTRDFPGLIRDILFRRDEIALHTHFGGLFGSPIPSTAAKAGEMCLRAKRRLERFTGEQYVLHRSGCFYQSALTYQGIRRACLRVVSDVNPTRKILDAEGRLLDNSGIPFNVAPWRHDAVDWCNFRSRRGWFTHIPVYCEGITMVPVLADRLLRRTIVPPVVCWDIHPHEIQNDDGTLSGSRIKTLIRDIRTLHRVYRGEPLTFRDYLRRQDEFNGRTQ